MTIYQATLAPRRLLRFTLLLLLIGFFSLTVVHPANAQEDDDAQAQELEDDFERDDDVDEGENEEEEEDDDEEDTPAAELRRLLEERSEITAELDGLREELVEMEARLETLNVIIPLQRKMVEAWEKLEEATEAGNEAAVATLEDELEQAEMVVEQRREMREIETGLGELTFALEKAKQEGQQAKVDVLFVMVSSLREMKEVIGQLHKIYVTGPESAEGPLEARVQKLEQTIGFNWRLLELTNRLEEAREDGDKEQIETIEQRIRAHKERTAAQSEFNQPETLVDEARQPIGVTEAGLAEFAGASLDQDVAPLLQKYCFDCHASATQSGELDIERLLSESPIVKNRDKWINVIEQSKNRVMPPEDELQPSEDERRLMVLALHNAIHNFDYSGIKNPGFEQARRLSHVEYDNTVRDLFGVDVKPAAKFPADLSGTSGFENSANTLFIQPLLMERYVGAAEEVVDASVPTVATTEAQKNARRMLFFRSPAEDSAPGEIVKRFLTRAYRRPVSESELSRAMKQFQLGRDQGLSAEDSIKAVMRTTLISPNFLLRYEEQQETDEAHRVSDWELASRLSYFLWASMPDDELFDLARRGELHQPHILSLQIDRMLADAKSETLGTVFAGQWLGSHTLGVRYRPDPIDNAWCTDTLMTAMRNETAMFFHSLVVNNQPAQRLIDADYTYLNEELAKHYRIPGVRGEEMRPVKLTSDKRGGIFGHGSLLAITSFPGRTSPVVRGKWILADVLGTPPPPPPPNVSELPEEIEENDRLTFREKLELHRRKPNCYACHSQMDPLGFSLQNYDWFGRYRSRSGRKKADMRGKLPNGTEFEGLSGLKKVIVEQRSDDLLRQISRKMLSYALGRQLEYYDEPAVRKIVEAVKQDDYRLQRIVREVVASYPFQYKQKQTDG